MDTDHMMLIFGCFFAVFATLFLSIILLIIRKNR